VVISPIVAVTAKIQTPIHRSPFVGGHGWPPRHLVARSPTAVTAIVQIELTHLDAGRGGGKCV